jgi:osmotically-inducible protein OsmY
MRQLEWDPEVDAAEIGVAARNGSVSLSGLTGTYSSKLAAERAAKRVHGVRAVANDIDVRLRFGRTDADIAQDAARALELRSTVPEGIQATVRQGYITLTGNAEWLFQKEGAEQAVRHIRSVRGVHDHISVQARPTVRDVRHRIVKLLHQNADVDARHITVDVTPGVATLSGTVSTWLQRDPAERAAASVPGITRVDNRISLQPSAEPVVDEWNDGSFT